MKQATVKLGEALFSGEDWLKVDTIAQCIETILLTNKISIGSTKLKHFSIDWAIQIVDSPIGTESNEIAFFLVHLSQWVSHLNDDQKSHIAANPETLVLNLRVEGSVIRGEAYCANPSPQLFEYLMELFMTALGSVKAWAERPQLENERKEAEIDKLRTETKTLDKCKSKVKSLSSQKWLPKKETEDSHKETEDS